LELKHIIWAGAGDTADIVMHAQAATVATRRSQSTVDILLLLLGSARTQQSSMPILMGCPLIAQMNAGSTTAVASIGGHGQQQLPNVATIVKSFESAAIVRQ
jgi:hypothetical protein